ncbi:MAG: cation-translocating P-type ATPase [bacterium]|nr:cation-translocating P-type ATPase [bacterium]
MSYRSTEPQRRRCCGSPLRRNAIQNTRWPRRSAFTREQHPRPGEPERFEALLGRGIRAVIEGQTVVIGNRRLVPIDDGHPIVSRRESEGKTLLIMAIDGPPSGILAAMDNVRPEVSTAIDEIRKLGIQRPELRTGGNERTAAAIASPLGIGFQANLLPEDKIRAVRELQAKGHRVVMVGDGRRRACLGANRRRHRHGRRDGCCHGGCTHRVDARGLGLDGRLLQDRAANHGRGEDQCRRVLQPGGPFPRGLRDNPIGPWRLRSRRS